MIKGTIKKTKKGWVVFYQTMRDELTSSYDSIPLHPEDVEKFSLLSQMFDNFEARVKKDPKVDFEIIDNFAKLIHDI
jgi:hypothetical protein